jgi:hypothetical protein
LDRDEHRAAFMTNNAKGQRQGKPSADITSTTITDNAIERFCQITVRG